MKAFAAAALVASQIPVVPVVQPASVDDARVLRCEGFSGTVWRISGDRYITADHVSGARSCTMDGAPARVIHRDLRGDVAVISTARGVGREYEIDCNGFVGGRRYRVTGYANGRTLHTSALVATGRYWIGHWHDEPGVNRVFAVLLGTGYPGMSGAPIRDLATGKAVGMLNGGTIGVIMARPLSETALCRGGV